MATPELIASAGSRRPSADGAASARDQGRDGMLTGHDVALGWILAAMIAFGGTVGLVLPSLVTSMIDLRDGQELPFRLACIVAGFCVGGFAYGVSKFTLYRANRRLAVLAAYDPLTKLPNRREFRPRAWLGAGARRPKRRASESDHRGPRPLQGRE